MTEWIRAIAYKQIPIDGGCVYVFAIWPGGVYACFRRVMWANGSHTRVYSHKLHTARRSRTRYMRIDYDEGKHVKVSWEEIKATRWHALSIKDASKEMGISEYALRRIERRACSYYTSSAVRSEMITKHMSGAQRAKIRKSMTGEKAKRLSNGYVT